MSNVCRYSIIVIDEAHERSLNTDLLLAMLCDAMRRRPELRLVITSATINEDLFLRFFAEFHPACIKVGGRLFPINMVYRPPASGDIGDEDNYLNGLVDATVQICLETWNSHPATLAEAGDVLVFAVNPDDCDTGAQQLAIKMAQRMRGFADKYSVLRLHGRLEPDEQQAVMRPDPLGKRKVIFSTSIAEMSVTINGIRVVVDSGLGKEYVFDPKKMVSSLVVGPISKSSAKQRAGRAGRTCTGTCYRLYSEQCFTTEMVDGSRPEIMRSQPSMAVLKLLSFGTADVTTFRFVESPGQDVIAGALDFLTQLGAHDPAARGLTALGRLMSQLTCDPSITRFIVTCYQQGHSESGFVAAAMMMTLSSSFLVFRNKDEDSSAEVVQQRQLRLLALFRGDNELLTFVRILQEYKRQPVDLQGAWCKDRTLVRKTLRAADELATGLKREFEAANLQGLIPRSQPDLVDVDDEVLSPVLTEAFASGFFMNLAVYSGSREIGYHIVAKDQSVFLHPSSSLQVQGHAPLWIIFHMFLETSRPFCRNIVAVDPAIVARVVPAFVARHGLEDFRAERYQCLAEVVEVTPAVSQLLLANRGALIRAFEAEVHCNVLVTNPSRTVFNIILPRQHPDVADVQSKWAALVAQQDVLCRQERLERSIASVPGCRVVLGDGGAIQTLLLGAEYVRVCVNDLPPPCTLEALLAVAAAHHVAPVSSMWRPAYQAGPAFKSASAILTYATTELAMQALTVLHEASVCGTPLKCAPLRGTVVGLNASDIQDSCLRGTYAIAPSLRKGIVVFESPLQARQCGELSGGMFKHVRVEGTVCSIIWKPQLVKKGEKAPVIPPLTTARIEAMDEHEFRAMSTVSVNKLPARADEESLRREFAHFGPIRFCQVFRDTQHLKLPTHEPKLHAPDADEVGNELHGLHVGDGHDPAMAIGIVAPKPHFKLLQDTAGQLQALFQPYRPNFVQASAHLHGKDGKGTVLVSFDTCAQAREALAQFTRDHPGDVEIGHGFLRLKQESSMRLFVSHSVYVALHANLLRVSQAVAGRLAVDVKLPPPQAVDAAGRPSVAILITGAETRAVLAVKNELEVRIASSN
jgi:hypothetical protein